MHTMPGLGMVLGEKNNYYARLLTFTLNFIKPSGRRFHVYGDTAGRTPCRMIGASNKVGHECRWRNWLMRNSGLPGKISNPPTVFPCIFSTNAKWFHSYFIKRTSIVFLFEINLEKFTNKPHFQDILACNWVLCN